MNTTVDFIEALVASARPVRRLRPPLWRTGAWVAGAGVLLAFIGTAHGARVDLGVRLQDPAFMIGALAALATAILAALAAFELSLPDRSRAWIALPLPALALWVSSMGYECWSPWIVMDPAKEPPGETLRCLSTLAFTSVPLLFASALMLRHAALVRPGSVAVAIGIAVGAMAGFAMTLFHDLDASKMILVWHLGAGAFIAAVGGALSRYLLAWLSPLGGWRSR